MWRKQLILIEKYVSEGTNKPLVIQGARQVGKSALLKLFAEQQDRPLVSINLERHHDLAPIFASKDPIAILDVLRTLPGVETLFPGALLFLDNIQAVPEALPALRGLHEKMPELAIISAASLLEFLPGGAQSSLPAGSVEYLQMGPMTFTEFLSALDESKLAELIHTWQPGKDIDAASHQRLLELLRLYYHIGGMPAAVKVYAETRSLSAVNEEHHAILQTCRDDFPKYIGSRNLARIRQVFRFAASSVGQKVRYSQFSSSDKSATIKSDIELLCMAGMLARVVHSPCNNLPLQYEREARIYKLLFLDIGLMNAIGGLSWQHIAAMNELRLVNEGSGAKQFIGQHLLELFPSPDRELNWWLREGRSNNAELDYVIALNGTIVPIQVKAGASGSLKSLMQFMAEKELQTAIRFDASPPTTQTLSATIRRGSGMQHVSFKLISLPLYLVEALPAVAAELGPPGQMRLL